ncbi:MAG: tRNA (adenosine(37)-N6)-threonylcarbamoyltransferase complex ATPase subunit type 1 TsaE [Bacteroidales bacterium]|nr:tRNA (adenosine(37)-N6)-threonylcarbamoyltransferase complex ATPase subunit type 1 TsaE [Bacteroidales bacterium]
MTVIRINSLKEIHKAAEQFLADLGDKRVVAFYGNLGAGKTTFITALCDVLGVEDIVCSPTFTIVNEYRTSRGEPVYHFDFYRINRLSEAQDIGLDEYLYSGHLCLIEWPEKIEELLPEDVVRVKIEVTSPEGRLLKF